MNINIRGLPDIVTKYDVTKELAKVIHSNEFHPTHDEQSPDVQRLMNFQVVLNINEHYGGFRNDGTGTLTMPNAEVGKRFLDWVKTRPIHMKGEQKRQKLRFHSAGFPPKHTAMTLERTPYIDPDIEIEHEAILEKLHDEIRVDTVQFGVYYYSVYFPKGPAPSREFSIEWQGHYITDSKSAWLSFRYDHKLIRIRLTAGDNEAYDIHINFSSIRKIGGGYDGKPYLCFDLITPPTFECINIYHEDGEKAKLRVGSVHPGHEAVAPYASQLRLLLFDDKAYLPKFKNLCDVANLSSLFRILPSKFLIAASAQLQFFSAKTLYKIRKTIAKFDWAVAFQLEALLLNGRLITRDFHVLLPRIDEICKQHSSAYAGDLLIKFSVELEQRDTPGKVAQDAPLVFFDRVRRDFVYEATKLSSGHFLCCHVTFTPTRTILEGPYATQSNRIIRQYADYEHNFIRVDFRDEDRLQYRWDRSVDGARFVDQRVGAILREGFTLGGREFKFLAYSSSALREHAVWFLTPFQHHLYGRVDADFIRTSIGSFQGTVLMHQPSKLAARLGQAFTATDPSVRIKRDQWEEVEDVAGSKKYVHTDGAGTISQSLADEIWRQLCRDRRDHGMYSIKPSAYQIRFLGFKGVVAVDKTLDDSPIRMRLRPSMGKFDVGDEVKAEADIEIARAFDRPNACYLNRALIMVLEDQHVSFPVFDKLQDAALLEARTIRDSLDNFTQLLQSHSLGYGFRLPTILEKLKAIGYELPPNPVKEGLNPFLEQLRQVASFDAQRDIKHQARIPIPGSFKLVGVPDEGPTYEGKEGYENIFCLAEGRIAACVQNHGEQPVWLEGACTISRSPIAHIGDVQRVFAMKPPDDRFCAFSHLVNVVVIPIKGRRPLSSCLGGGDLDGDQYDIIMEPDLLPSEKEEPAEYDSCGTYELPDDRECDVNDICQFIVNYINSDVLGLLSDRLLIIADQSTVGMRDTDCKKLATLCSQAVDYPKNGIPVDIEDNRLPKTLIRCKPDWHAAEVVNPRKTDYYRSERVLGKLYRKIALDEVPPNTELATALTSKVDDITERLIRYVQQGLIDFQHPPSIDLFVTTLFRRYDSELRFIRATHTISNTPGVMLIEAELVIGIILAKCTQRRARQDRMWKMRVHVAQLIREVKHKLFPLSQTIRDNGGDEHVDPEEVRAGLSRAWSTWEYAMKNVNEEGAKSLALVALDVVFDCLERLGIHFEPAVQKNRKNGNFLVNGVYESD